MSGDPTNASASADLTTENQYRDLHLGYFASMKRGFEQFIHREITHAEARGATVTVFPTKVGPGLYGPRDTWRVIYWSVAAVLWAQPFALLQHRTRYLRSLAIAMRYGAVTDMLLAAYFAKQTREVDVLHATFGDRKFFVGFFVKRLTGKPLMCTTHAYDLFENPNPELFRVALAECDQMITISQYNRQYLQEHFGYPMEKTEVVTYSIDLDEYQPRYRFVIAIVGFFVERKGHEVLFEAVKKLDNSALEIWVIGGEGAESDSVDVREMARKHGIESQVAFVGKQSGTALKAMYHACDVFCLPCHFDRHGVGEGFPNVIIEAMACGKPVISTRHVAIPSILPEVLTDEKDVDGLAAAIDQLYRSPELRERLGKQNRDLAKKHFSPDNVEKSMQLAQSLATWIVLALACGWTATSQAQETGQVGASPGKKPFVSTLPPQIQSRVLFSADAESGTFDEWDDKEARHPGGGVLNTGPGHEAVAAISSSHAFSGNRSFATIIRNAYRCQSGNRAVRLMRWTDRPWDQGGKPFPHSAFYSVWMMVPENYNCNKYAPWDPGDGGWWIVFQFKSHDDQDVSLPTWSVNLYFNDESQRMELGLYSQVNDPASVIQRNPISVPLGRWFHLEAEYVVSADRAGSIAVWQDGMEILRARNVKTVVSRRNENAVWGIGNYTDHVDGGSTPGSATLYFDDAIVSTTAIHPFVRSNRQSAAPPTDRAAR